MKIASWNINSLNVRMPRVQEFLSEESPDVLCLQETKARPEAFPHLEVQMAGYQAVDHSAGGRNGVAILIRDGLGVSEVVTGLDGEPDPSEARWVQATVDGTVVASVYVPNGRSLDHPVFADKLAFLDGLVTRAATLRDRPTVIAGDFNIAPGDLDVYDPARYVGSTHTSEQERRILADLADLGFQDVYRRLHPGAQQFTWWDYRAGHFHKNLGMRIDLFMASQPLWSGRRFDYRMVRDFRKGTKPSDHAPIVLTYSQAATFG